MSVPLLAYRRRRRVRKSDADPSPFTTSRATGRQMPLDQRREHLGRGHWEDQDQSATSAAAMKIALAARRILGGGMKEDDATASTA